MPWAVEYDPLGVGDGDAVASFAPVDATAGSVGNARRAMFGADLPDGIEAPHRGHHRASPRFAMPVRRHRTVPIQRNRAALVIAVTPRCRIQPRRGTIPQRRA